ncbi:MAG TPA: hypothetical protein VGQ37_02810 [Vicinamibacterales bacterium]|nr:hypothetical protein [Vicinamibacterales bacterium]
MLALTGLIAYEVCRIPVQVSDSLGNLLQVQPQTLGDVFAGQFSNGAYVRPLLWAQIKLAYDAAGGHETVVFKALHVVQLVLLALLVLRLMAVRSPRESVAAILAVLVLFGIHTFDGLVREAFPINSFLTIALCVLGVLALADGEPARWRDVAAAVTCATAILILESGLLVAAAAVCARLAGMRGISRKGAAVVVGLVAAYLLIRFAVLGAGTPSLSERASGFGFRVLEPGELVTRFGSNPWPFYLYNVAASFATVLLAEPRGGVWYATHGVAAGEWWPAWLWVNVAASVVAAGLVLRAVPIALGRWRAANAGRHEHLLLVAVAVLGANAVVSFGYTKDVIMSTGGVCFALAVYAATAMLLESTKGPRARMVRTAVVLGLALWTVRTTALPLRLEMQAARVQQEWRDVYAWLERQHIAVTTPDAEALVTRLRRSALRARPRAVEWTGWRSLLDLN